MTLPVHVLCSVVFAGSILAQTATTPPAFEVASIKPSEPGMGRPSIFFERGGRRVTKNATLKHLLAVAYNLPANRISAGPGWLNAERYDIIAKPGSFLNPSTDSRAMELLRSMLQGLLAERFKVEIHWETKEAPMYALIVSKNGPKLTAVPGPSGGEGSVNANLPAGRLNGKGPMSRLARDLSNFLGRPVVDETGLKGDFELKLEWTPEQNPTRMLTESGEGGVPDDPVRPSIFSALQEQLGLKLQSRHGPAQILVIDRAEKASEN